MRENIRLKQKRKIILFALMSGLVFSLFLPAHTQADFTNGQSASLVLGQADFITIIATTTQNRLYAPFGMDFDTSGNLWVADTSNNRILRFTPPFTNGMYASLVIGQNNFTTKLATATQNGLYSPLGIDFDTSGNLWVADGANFRVLKFVPPFTNGMNASLVIGQSGFTTYIATTTKYGFGKKDNVTNVISPNGLAFDNSGNLWVSDGGNFRVLKFTPPFTNGMDSSLVIGQDNFTSAITTTTQTGFGLRGEKIPSPIGLIFNGLGNLWVVDTSNNRILRFTPPFTNGMYASLVIGQNNFTTKLATTTQNGFYSPLGIDFDTSGNLWVADGVNCRVLMFIPTVAIGSVSGKVTKSDGSTAIQGALVELLRDSVIVSSATTDTSGNYSIIIATGTFNLRALATGCITKTTTGVVVIAGQITTVDFVLSLIGGDSITGVKFTLYNNLFDPTKNQSVVIRYELPENIEVRIIVYDFRGNLVKNLVNSFKTAGVHTETWDGKNDEEVIVASGAYPVQIKAGSFKETKKVIVIK